MTEPQTVSQSTDPPFPEQTMPWSTEGIVSFPEAQPDEVVDQYDPTKAGESPYDSPEFQQELKEGIEAQIEGWHKDWSIRIDALMAALGLSRSEAMMYLLLMQIGTVRGLASGFQQMWNAEPAQKRRAMQDRLLEEQLKGLGLELSSDSQQPALPPDEAVKKAVQRWKIR